MTNTARGKLYVGSTVDLVKRVHEHKERFVQSYTFTHGLNKLVYFEIHTNLGDMLQREYLLKRWRRQWKISLIESQNPNWNDLWDEIKQDM